MKAVILAAGVGSRIRPMTNDTPKCLLKIGRKTILEMMISNIKDCGINEIVFVVGYLQEKIKNYMSENFSDIKTTFISNDKYLDTNTGFSLMLVENAIKGDSFIKFDADVVFDKKILENLIQCKYKNCLCIDKNINLDAEEIKVITKDDNRVMKASKTVDPKQAVGESIGIEKIDTETGILLFSELRKMMVNKKNHQAYYESAYENLIENNIPFHALDISGLDWTEIDTKEDFIVAVKIFDKSCS